MKVAVELFSSVSIHVPARGTTGYDIYTYDNYGVSIHVPARGTTRRTGFHPARIRGFNPRSRKGNDKNVRKVYTDIDVSIHVPARGTTGDERAALQDRPGFNPRSRKGNDDKAKEERWSGKWFQSTFPQGERHGMGLVP